MSESVPESVSLVDDASGYVRVEYTTWTIPDRPFFYDDLKVKPSKTMTRAELAELAPQVDTHSPKIMRGTYDPKRDIWTIPPVT